MRSKAYVVTRSIVRAVLFTVLILAPLYLAAWITDLFLAIFPY